jgi:hypothetical protein
VPVVTRRRLGASVWPAGQQSSDEIAGWQGREQYQIFGLKLPGLGAPIESFMPVNLSEPQAGALCSGLMPVGGSRRYSLVLTSRLQDGISIGVGVRDSQRVRDTFVVSSAAVPDFVPRSTFFVGESNERLR